MSQRYKYSLFLLILSSVSSILSAEASHNTCQVDSASTEIHPVVEDQYMRGISGSWHMRLGISSVADRGYFCFPFAWELPSQISLRGTLIQPVIAWGYLQRTEDRDEHLPGGFTDYYEGIFYAMYEVQRQWRTRYGRLGGSLHTGFGMGYSIEQYYNLFDEIQEWKKGVAWIASAGIQLEAKIPELPTMVADVRFYHTPNYGTSYVVSYGIRGNLLHVVGAWGLIIATYIILGG